MNNLRKFTTEAEYTAATLNYPSVAWVTSTDVVHFDKENPTPTFSGLTITYNIVDISSPTQLFKGGGSGSGSGSGGVLPSAMIIDGTEVEVTNSYQFSTTGIHIVNYSFEDNQIPNNFLNDNQIASASETVRKVEIGDAIITIGEYAFTNCENITAVTIGNGVTSIGDEAFNYCTSLASIVIPDSVTSIGNTAFNGCSGLTSCTIGSGVTSISSIAFGACSSLPSVDIPDSVTSIGDGAFSLCSGLTSVTIGSGLTSIGSSAFRECTSLTSIDIPSGVTSIGSYAFYRCSGLTNIVSNATTAPIISNYTFRDVKTGGTLYVPSGSSGYDTWMQNANYYLGLYGWTKVEQ